MKTFLDQDYLLTNKISQDLYHMTARELPVIDFHNHLNPQYLCENKKYNSLSELWVTGDPYKHRAMRIHGIPEDGITGNADEKEKYLNWVNTFPKTIGNPLFDWSCMELKRVFGVDELLSGKNAEEIWEHCNLLLQKDEYSTMSLLKKWNVELLCTSDDLLDNLIFHTKATNSRFGIKVLPSLRGDSIINFDPLIFSGWLAKLEMKTGRSIKELDHYKMAIIKCLDEFNESGCLLADHSLDAGFKFEFNTRLNPEVLFKQILSGNSLTVNESATLKNHLLLFLGEEYSKRKWILQLHIGAQRFTSTRLREKVGPAGGYASIGETCDLTGLCRFLDLLEKKEHLPDIILYTLNPADNAAFATLTGSFSEDGKSGKIQFGPAWWYNDHYDGIKQQLQTLSVYGLLGHFIGMTTDSRSVLSFSRHEYFRRILCDMIGVMVENRRLPNDRDLLETLIGDISYYNIKRSIYNRNGE